MVKHLQEFLSVNHFLWKGLLLKSFLLKPSHLDIDLFEILCLPLMDPNMDLNMALNMNSNYNLWFT